MSGGLFPDFNLPDALANPAQTSASDPQTAAPARAPRLRRPQRHQAEFRCESLEQLLPPDDPARLVWQFVETLDLTPLLQRIRSVEGQAGRDALDPRVPMALWLMATIDGIGSARALNELCLSHLRYRWLCGGLSVNYHSLSDFRTAHPEFLEAVLVESIASMLQQRLVHLTEVAQDGMRVRASAGSSSFRREATLKECQQQAQAQVDALKGQADEGEDASPTSPPRRSRQQAAQQRAARERLERIERALQQRDELLQQKQQQQSEKGAKFDAEQLRASTTDPQARRMKMPDGGTRPGYNFQFATATDSGLIVGVDVTNSGSDSGQMGPMIDRLREHYGQSPERILVDGSFAALADLERTQREHQAQVYAPVKEEKQKLAQGENPYQAKPRDTPLVGQWRERMGTEAAKQIYRRRASTAEWVNAGMRQRGLYQVLVRGLTKVRAVAYWHALAHNLLRVAALPAAKAA